MLHLQRMESVKINKTKKKGKKVLILKEYSFLKELCVLRTICGSSQTNLSNQFQLTEFLLQ